MIDLNVKLNDNHVDPDNTLEDLIKEVYRAGYEFDYKNTTYFIDFWDKEVWQCVTNLNEHNPNIPESTHFFNVTSEKDIENLFETFKMHDGTPLWQIFVDKKYSKYFGFQKGKIFK